MAIEDYMEPEVAVAVVLTAAAASPKARRVMRKGAVYGMAGVLKAGDALGVFARGVGRGVQEAARAVEDEAESLDPSGNQQDESPHAARRPARPRARHQEGAAE